MCFILYTVEPLIKNTPNKRKNLSMTHLVPKVHFPIILVHFNLRREDNLSIKDKMPGPNVSIIWTFHCMCVPTLMLSPPCRRKWICYCRGGSPWVCPTCGSCPSPHPSVPSPTSALWPNRTAVISLPSTKWPEERQNQSTHSSLIYSASSSLKRLVQLLCSTFHAHGAAK